MSKSFPILARAEQFCQQFQLRLPILLAPMAGACPVALSLAVSKAGGMGGCGVLLMSPAKIADWAEDFRNRGGGAFQVNNWIPDPMPIRDADHERQVSAYLKSWNPSVTGKADLTGLPEFGRQLEAMLSAQPTAITSIMGLYSEPEVDRIKASGSAWFATVTSVTEARQAQSRGADAIVAQGAEAGGHRGTFEAANAEALQAGLFSLLPAIADHVDLPVIAAGGIADARGIAAALHLGASAVQIGTGYLRCPEADIPSAWAAAIGKTLPEDTLVTRAFSGRPGRAYATKYVRHAHSDQAPAPAPYPVQRSLTAPMTAAARRENRLEQMQAWTGQSGRLSQTAPAGELTQSLWKSTLVELGLS